MVLRPGIPASLLWFVVAAAWAQGVIIPDLRNPALYNEPAKGAASCRVCGEIRSISAVYSSKDESRAWTIRSYVPVTSIAVSTNEH